ncbi:MAG: ABC transporter permease, partial [Candidatus Binatia bacterium]
PHHLIMSTLVIARLTFREAIRRKIVLAALALGALFLIVYGVGYSFIEQELQREMASVLERNEVRTFILTAGLYVVNFLMVMLTVLTSVDTLAGEIGSGTIHAIAAKPLRRLDIILGKWMGFAAMLTLYLLLMAGGVMGVVYLLSGVIVPHAAQGLTLMWLNVLLLLAVMLLGGAMLSTLTNGVMVFGLYAIAFIGGWIEHIGSFLQSQMAINIGIISSLIFPSEALWRRAAYEMQSLLVAATGFSPFSALSAPSPLMVGYAVLYAAVALVLAVRVFNRRDL